MFSTQLFNQQLVSTPFCPSRALQRMMSRCMVQDRQAQQALGSKKQTPDEVVASSHGWEWRFYALVILQITRISDSSCKKTSLRISMSQVEAELKLPRVQNSQSRVYAVLRHIANCPSNVRWQLPEFLIPWLNLVHCGPCLLCHPRAGWKQLLDFNHGN